MFAFFSSNNAEDSELDLKHVVYIGVMINRPEAF